MSSESFADLGVSRPVLGALAKRGITEPFAVQRLCIADVLAGEDVLVQSPTGSGKTLAFGIPMVERLDSNQARKAAKAHIIVATPGRLEDLIERGYFDLKRVRILVLDEADRMLDMGFKPPVDRIVSQMPRDRQTLFFSATLEGAAGKLAAAYTRDPRRHVHQPKIEKHAEVEHRFLHLPHEAKVDALVKELRDTERGRTLIFVRTKRGADRLVKKLAREQVRAVAMHGDKSQSQRRRALAGFERGDCDTLVATDVASRGIDVEDITHVINFDAPEDRDVYVHRTGRTGRAGASGVAASFVLPDQHRDMRQIASDLGLHHEFDSGPGFEHAARHHSGSGGSGGKSFDRGGRGNGKRHNSGNGGPRTYSARPPRNRRRRRRSVAR
jgi:superfamily II DNA/RNA helicase